MTDTLPTIPMPMPPPPPPPVPKKNWVRRHKVWTAVIAFTAVGIYGNATGAGEKDNTATTVEPPATTAEDWEPGTTVDRTPATTAEEPATTEAPTTTVAEPVEPVETVSQANARQSADSYLDYMPFSRTGLIGQLEYEGFSTADATYGVDSQTVDWNEQAALSAASYLDTMPFSHAELVDQLVYEGFTAEQAEYGVNTTGL